MSEDSENVEIPRKRSKKHHDPPDEESSQSEDGKPNHLDGDVIFRALGDSSMAVCRGKLKVKPRCQGINIYTIRGTLWSLSVLLDYLYDGEVGTHFEWYFVLDAWLAAQDLNLGKSTMKNFAQAFLNNWLARDRNWEDLFERRQDLFSIRDGGDSQEILLRELNKRHPLPIVLRGSNRRPSYIIWEITLDEAMKNFENFQLAWITGDHPLIIDTPYQDEVIELAVKLLKRQPVDLSQMPTEVVTDLAAFGCKYTCKVVFEAAMTRLNDKVNGVIASNLFDMLRNRNSVAHACEYFRNALQNLDSAYLCLYNIVNEIYEKYDPVCYENWANGLSVPYWNSLGELYFLNKSILQRELKVFLSKNTFHLYSGFPKNDLFLECLMHLEDIDLKLKDSDKDTLLNLLRIAVYFEHETLYLKIYLKYILCSGIPDNIPPLFGYKPTEEEVSESVYFRKSIFIDIEAADGSMTKVYKNNMMVSVNFRDLIAIFVEKAEEFSWFPLQRCSNKHTLQTFAELLNNNQNIQFSGGKSAWEKIKTLIESLDLAHFHLLPDEFMNSLIDHINGYLIRNTGHTFCQILESNQSLFHDIINPVLRPIIEAYQSTARHQLDPKMPHDHQYPECQLQPAPIYLQQYDRDTYKELLKLAAYFGNEGLYLRTFKQILLANDFQGNIPAIFRHKPDLEEVITSLQSGKSMFITLRAADGSMCKVHKTKISEVSENIKNLIEIFPDSCVPLDRCSNKFTLRIFTEHIFQKTINFPTMMSEGAKIRTLIECVKLTDFHLFSDNILVSLFDHLKAYLAPDTACMIYEAIPNANTTPGVLNFKYYVQAHFLKEISTSSVFMQFDPENFLISLVQCHDYDVAIEVFDRWVTHHEESLLQMFCIPRPTHLQSFSFEDSFGVLSYLLGERRKVPCLVALAKEWLHIDTENIKTRDDSAQIEKP